MRANKFLLRHLQTSGLWLAVLVLPMIVFSQQFPVTTLLNNGQPDNRINIVFLSEGYTANELTSGKFTNEATSALNYLLQKVPFNEYRGYFNAYTINVPSAESGTDHPATAADEPRDAQGNPILPAFSRDTYFNTTFDGNLTHRLLIVGAPDRVNRVLQDNFPQYDIVFIVVNHTEYGGSGGSFAVFSLASSASEIAVHELGHSFAGLTDEYETPFPGITPGERPNATAQTQRQFIRWNSWIAATTPVPTPKTSQYGNVIGLFEGAQYFSTGWYRPKLDCRMRSLGIDFCAVCSEAIVTSAYRVIDLIDSSSPAATHLSISTSDAVDFQVTLLSPTSHQIATQWYLDDVALANQTTPSYRLQASTIDPGPHKVRVEARDATALVRNDPNEVLKQSKTWTVFVCPGSQNVDAVLVIDRSGSMGQSGFMQPAKIAASTFVGFTQIGDKVAVISFNEGAAINFPLTTIASAATKTAAQSAIDAIVSSGATSIGAGILTGQSELNKGNTQVHQGMVLLSDGFENTAPNVTSVLPTIPANTDIYTIALGSASDQALLNNIAKQTGGIYYFSPDASQLHGIYNQIRSNVTRQQVFATFKNVMNQGVTQLFNSLVDALTCATTFAISFQTGDIDLELVSPSGRLITPVAVAGDPNITYTEGPTYDFYTISAPEAGLWTLRVIGTNVPAAQAYAGTLQGTSLLTMDSFLDKNEYTAGQPILVSAKLLVNATPITGASVTAEVQAPTSSNSAYQLVSGRRQVLEKAEMGRRNTFQKESGGFEAVSTGDDFVYVTSALTLYDDGGHGDGAANDGVYANYFNDTSKDGSYTFNITATGTATSAGVFRREIIFSTFVKPPTTGVLAPSVTTMPATNVKPTAALLHGAVNPNGASTAAYFEYGTTTSYGSRTVSIDVGSGTSAVSVSRLIENLNPITRYHFRLVATNSGGTSFGGDFSFITLPLSDPAPMVSSVSPDRGQAGQTLDVTITGANFATGAVISFSGGEVTVNSTSFVNATQLSANITIAANASAGSHDVVVTNPDGQSGTGAGLFQVVGCGTTTFSDNFENGTDNWLTLTPASWGINLLGNNNVFCLSVPNAVRDEYAIQRDEPWLDFDLTLEAKSDATSNKNFFIVFGTTDFHNATSNGYYLQFTAGNVKLYRATGGGRGVEIASAARDYVSDNLFHQIRVERKLPNIKVTVDGSAVLNINDGAFAIGSIGFGSFNSQACFDEVNITGARSDPAFYIDAFDDGDADGWSPLTPSRWQVGNESGSLRYFINTTNYEPPNSARLGELSVLAGKALNDFVFECHAKSADAAASNENADLALVFGYQDFDSYYYVNFNTAPGLTQLFRTHNGANTVLATYNQSTFNAGGAAYHALRVERSGSQIRVFFDGAPVLTATDSFFGAGLLGIGSYNDAGYFDNIAVTGGCSSPPGKIPVTFQVNMTVQICENRFTPAADQLSIRGSFNGFVDGANVLTDPDGDGIYTTVVEFDAATVGTTIDYKYSFLHGAQPVVESLANRQFIIPNGGATAPVVFFNNDNQCDRLVAIFPSTTSPPTAGSEFIVDINIGDNTNTVSNLFGVSFELNYTSTAFIDVVAPTSANVTPGPFLGNDVIFVSNVDALSGKISIGVSRKAGQGGVNGNGVVARIKFKSQATTPNGTIVTFDLRNVTANDPPGNAIALTASSATVTISSGILVWPGDTNNDKIVNQADVLPLGLYWSQTGPKRSNASNAWIGQSATSWSPVAATYADATGDGIVNQADVLPIGLHFGKTHTAQAAGAERNELPQTLHKTNAATIRATFTGNTNPGQDFAIEVVVSEVTNLFGVSFELLYSPTALVDPQKTESGSLMGNDPIFFSNLDKTAGKISIGNTRKAGQSGVTGTGVVARIEMHVSAQAVRGQAITLTLQNVTANDANAQPIVLTIVPSPIVVVSVSSQQNETLPQNFALYANRPNPFNPTTAIHYDLPQAGEVSVEIFDLLGKHVRTLVQQQQAAGRYSVVWDGRDENAQLVASGVFIYQLRVGNPSAGSGQVPSSSSGQSFVQRRKMLLVR